MATLSTFQIGDLYSNDTVIASLGVGNAGGIRLRLNDDDTVRRIVLMTALPTVKNATENPYHDRIEGDVLTYTGKGLRGDQEEGSLNARLSGQRAGALSDLVLPPGVQPARQHPRQGPLAVPGAAVAHPLVP